MASVISDISAASGRSSAALRARVAERARQVAEAKLALAEARLNEDIAALENAEASEAAHSRATKSEKQQKQLPSRQIGHFGHNVEAAQQPPVEHAVSYAPGAIAGDTQPSPFVFSGLHPFSSQLPYNSAHVENLRNLEQQQRPICHGGHGDSCSASHKAEIKPSAATFAAVPTAASAAAGSLLDGAPQSLESRSPNFPAFLRNAGPD